jgi:hypothetical protein
VGANNEAMIMSEPFGREAGDRKGRHYMSPAKER